MSGRAETPEQKRAVIERILAAWLRMPDLRFGQLVSAAADRAEHDAFYIRDEALCEAVEALASVSATIVLSPAELERVRDLCENPPEPTEALRRLMRGEQK